MYSPLISQSAYSLLESTLRLSEYVKQGAELGYTALGLSDHNVLHGVVEFYQLCQRYHIQPIIGLTLDYPTHDEQEQLQVYLIAKNQIGYQQLMRLSSRKMTGTERLIQQATEVTELIAIFPQKNEWQSATTVQENQAAPYFHTYFDQENCYYAVTPELLALADFSAYQNQMTAYGLRPVALEVLHSLNEEDSFALTVMAHIQEGTVLDKTEFLAQRVPIAVLESPNVQAAKFADFPEALTGVAQIVADCQVELALHQSLLPSYALPPGQSAADYLKVRCEEGLVQRRLGDRMNYRERLAYELAIIHQMGFDDYFLIVWDVMNFAHQQKIVTGAGRGSAAGSLVAYLLHITEVDPIKYDLLFERFLNPERYTMPDIDLDIPDNRREEVLQYVKTKYGQDFVAQIATFGTMAAKMALRDVSRVFGFSQSEANRWSKAVPNKLKISLTEAYEESKSFRELVELNERNQLVYQVAKRIEGLPRHVSTHAAGVVISDRSLWELVPLQAGTGDIYLTQFTMNDVETLGLLKMDFLGLRNLAIIDDTLKGIEYLTHETVTQSMIPLDDKQTYQLFQKGETAGIFQFESAGIRAVLRKLGPENLEDIAAVNALYRPGPAQMIDSFIRRKKGQETISYPDDSLQTILASTYGVMVYQEQVMQVASKMAGFSLGEADILRRAIGKKKRSVLDEQRQKFCQGAQQNGVSLATAEKVYDYIERFADYGFNRSHAFAYSVIGYQMGFLKVHYPVAFFRALLQSVQGNGKKIQEYLGEAKKQHVAIYTPSINASFMGFSFEGKQALRFGLGSIKGVRRDVAQAIIEERKAQGLFQSFDQFLLRMNQANPRFVKVEQLIPLIQIGAFDELVANRRQLLQELEGKLQNVTFSAGSADLLELMPLKTTEVTPFSPVELLTFEEELLGMYVSGHPVQKYRKIQTKLQPNSIAEVLDKQLVRILGYVKSLREIRTKKGERMAFAQVSDQSGEMSVTLFPEVYRAVRSIMKEDEVYLFEGRVEKSKFNGEWQLLVVKAQAGEYLEKELETKTCYLKIDKQHQDSAVLNELLSLLKQFKGEMPVILYYEEEKKQKMLERDLWVAETADLMEKLQELLGSENSIFK